MDPNTCNHEYEHLDDDHPNDGWDFWICRACNTRWVATPNADEIHEFPS